MKNKKTLIFGICTVVSFAAVAICVSMLVSFLSNYKPTGTSSSDGDVKTIVDENNNTVSLTEKNDSKEYNFLVLGHDRAASLTDVIMLINVNVENGGVTIMQIPRDTFVGYDIPTGKINATFSTLRSQAYKENAKDPTYKALRDFADIIEENFCIKIHFTAIMDLDGFVQIVDAVGGVDVDVPARMEYNDEAQGLYINIPAGKDVHLDGKKAEQFVRFRSAYVQADIGRGNAQKIFMTAFIEKVKSIGITKLNSLADILLSNLTTDVSASDFVYFVGKMISVDLKNVTMLTLPGEATNNGRGSYYVMNEAAVLQIINKYYNIYDADITKAIFDRNNTYVDLSGEVKSIYYGDAEKYLDTNVFNAKDISENSIDIPRLH